MKSQQSPKTLQFQRSKFNIRNSLRGITCEIECGLSDAASEGWPRHLWAAGHAAVPLGGGLAWLRADALSHAQQHGAAGVKGAGGTGGARGRRRGLAGQHTDTPTDWRPPRGLRGLAGLRADALSHAQQHGGRHAKGAGEDRRGPWAAAGPGRASSRRAERSSRRGRRAGGRHPPAHTAAGASGARNASGTTSNTAQGRGPAGPRPRRYDSDANAQKY